MKYTKEQISFCIEILKRKEACLGIVCSNCLIRKECASEPLPPDETLPFFVKRSSKINKRDT